MIAYNTYFIENNFKAVHKLGSHPVSLEKIYVDVHLILELPQEGKP